MSESILTSTKKILGFEEDYTVYDLDVMTHINAVFSTLSQLGVGPSSGFAIVDASAKWSDFLGDNPNLNAVQTYVYLRVRLIFDPPGTSYLVEAYDKQIKEMEWRLNVLMEKTIWVDPDPDDVDLEDEEGGILDGGSP
jgi:hypothetical protein